MSGALRAALLVAMGVVLVAINPPTVATPADTALLVIWACGVGVLAAATGLRDVRDLRLVSLTAGGVVLGAGVIALVGSGLAPILIGAFTVTLAAGLLTEGLRGWGRNRARQPVDRGPSVGAGA